MESFNQVNPIQASPSLLHRKSDGKPISISLKQNIHLPLMNVGLPLYLSIFTHFPRSALDTIFHMSIRMPCNIEQSHKTIVYIYRVHKTMAYNFLLLGVNMN